MFFSNKSERQIHVVSLGEYDSSKPIATFDDPRDAQKFKEFYDQHYTEVSDEEADVTQVPHFGPGEVGKAINNLSRRKK